MDVILSGGAEQHRLMQQFDNLYNKKARNLCISQPQLASERIVNYVSINGYEAKGLV